MPFRILGWIVLALAAAIAVHDALSSWTDRAVHLVSIGELWTLLDPGSLSDTQVAVQRHLSVSLWNAVLRAPLALPALPVFLAVGLLLLWGGRRGRPESPGVLTGSRPGRRRRSRSSLS